MEIADITAHFGPPPGDPATLPKACRMSLERVFAHPLSHSIGWADMTALFAHLGTVTHKANDEVVFAIGDTHRLLRKAHGKTLAAEDVMAFRHLLARAGWSPAETGAKPGIPQAVPPQLSPTAGPPDMLVAIEHRQAHIYLLDVDPADAGDDVIRPYDPHGFLHHLTHKDQDSEQGQRVAEDPSYYERIAEALRPAARVVLIGHGHGHSNAAEHLAAAIKLHHKDIFPKLLPVVEADLSCLTKRQLLALGRTSLTESTIA